jgi:urea transport system ATP-binding protein
MSMLEVAGLQQYYGESHTLWDVDLQLEPGDCVGLLGRNGVGKTTLIKAIMGLVPVRGGRIVFQGKRLERSTSDERARVGVAYVPQGRQIFGQLTVEENLRIGASTLKKRGPIPEKIFGWFPVLREMLHRRGGDLSGGQQQQLAIGRALMLDPKLLILDEPTEGIQPNIVAQIGDVLDELARKEGLTVLAAEQKLGFVRRFARRFYVMDRGRTVAQGAIEALDEKLVQQYLTV